MSRIVISSDNAVVPRQRQKLTINGKLHRDVFCTQIDVSVGKQASTAVFSLPSKVFFDNLSRFDDAEVVVYHYSQGGRVLNRPIFRGYLETRTAEYDERTNRQTIKARGALHRLRRVYLGKNRGQGEVIYNKDDGWRLDGIVRDMFSSRSLSSSYRSVIGLGDLSGLRQASYEMQTMSFPGTSYLDALWTIVQFAGNVRIRERFTGSKTLLDFEAIGDSETPVRRIITPRRGVGPDQGGTTTRLRDAGNVEDIVNQVDAIGAPTRTMLTVRTETETTDAPLFPNWPLSTAYTESELTADETAVLGNPGFATPGHPSYSDTSDRRFIFRRFALPAVLQRYDIDAANVWRNSDNERIKVQAFIQDYTNYVDVSEDPTIDKQADGSTGYKIVKAQLIDGHILLSEPAVRVLRYEYVDSQQVLVRERAPVFVTITVSRRDERTVYSTGIRGNLNFPTISSAGVTLPIVNESARYERVGTGEDGLVYNNTAYTFGAIWFDEITGVWSEVEPDATPLTVRDDRSFLRSIANRTLAERSQRRTLGIRRIPRVTQGYRLMDRVWMGDKILQVMQISWSLMTDIATTIQATDALPDMINAERMKAPARDRPTPLGRAVVSAAGAGGVSRPAPSAPLPTIENQVDPFDRGAYREWVNQQPETESKLTPEQQDKLWHHPEGPVGETDPQDQMGSYNSNLSEVEFAKLLNKSKI